MAEEDFQPGGYARALRLAFLMVLGGLLAYPIAIAFMGKSAGELAFYAYVVPFLISTTGGAALAGLLLAALQKTGALNRARAALG